MKFITIMLFIALTTNTYASRTKKDLIATQEAKIATLLKEKIALVDKLIQEAKIYQNEQDPLIQKDFYNRISGFVTEAKKNKEVIQTHNNTSSLEKKEKTKERKKLSSNKIGVPSTPSYSHDTDRDILGIKMTKKTQVKALFASNINYNHILHYRIRKEIKSKAQMSRKDFAELIKNNFEKEVLPLSAELLQKYIKLINLLSKNDVSSVMEKLAQTNKAESWTIYAKAFLFKFSYNIPNLNKKKIYNLSLNLENSLKELSQNPKVKITSVPDYFDDRRIKSDFQCLESSKDIKYKGRICFNPINVDQNKYFTHGVFETREHNFLHVNAESFKTLRELDKKLGQASKEYIEYLIIKQIVPKKNTEIDLSGGL